MSLSKDTDAWANGESRHLLRDEIAEFLEDNSDSVYHLREIADQICDLDWSSVHEEERVINEIGEDEYYEQVDSGNRDEINDSSPGFAIRRHTSTTEVQIVLEQLIHENKVVSRSIPVEETDIPYGWDSVGFYGIA